MPQAMLELTSFEPESAQADAGVVKPDQNANGKEQQQAGEVQESGFSAQSFRKSSMADSCICTADCVI